MSHLHLPVRVSIRLSVGTGMYLAFGIYLLFAILSFWCWGWGCLRTRLGRDGGGIGKGHLHFALHRIAFLSGGGGNVLYCTLPYYVLSNERIGANRNKWAFEK